MNSLVSLLGAERGATNHEGIEGMSLFIQV